MKFAFTVACLFGLAVAGPVLFSEPLEKRCKGLQDHCSKDDECCSHHCIHLLGGIGKRCHT